MDLTAMETPVIGSSSDLQRLCTFLLRNAAGAAAIDEGGVAVHTSRIGDRVVLRIEDGGPPPPPQWLAHLFDASAPAREGTCALELAACRTMARRQRATIRAEARPEGGAALVLEWGVASI